MSEGRTCQCAHGGVLDDDGKPLSPCPGGHSPEPCRAEAELRLVPAGGLGKPEDEAYLCEPCAGEWLADGEWEEADSWEERYLVLVPEKLTLADARALLGLLEEDPQRFVEALEGFASLSEEVCC